jgi:hypothetical protein
MSPHPENAGEEDKALNAAKSSKVWQDPQPRRNKIQPRRDE